MSRAANVGPEWAAMVPKLFEDEADFQDQLIAVARRFGYRAYHTHNSRRSEPGFPDLVLASPRQRRVIFAELKTATGQLSDDQAWWAGVLTAAGEEYHLWRFKDWDAALAILTQKPEVPRV